MIFKKGVETGLEPISQNYEPCELTYLFDSTKF